MLLKHFLEVLHKEQEKKKRKKPQVEERVRKTMALQQCARAPAGATLRPPVLHAGSQQPWSPQSPSSQIHELGGKMETTNHNRNYKQTRNQTKR